MRSFLAGLLFLLLLSSSALAQQVSGFVESIGIEGKIRPDCWTPLRVSLTSQESTPLPCQLQVWQEDLDRDHVVYTRDITLSPNTTEKFETYCIFQPRLDKDKLAGKLSIAYLQRFLRVRVCEVPDKGKKPGDAKPIIERLPITCNADNIDPEGVRQGCRLVLYVTEDTGSKPVFYPQDISGLAEQIEMMAVHARDLGEKVLYYDAVDTVIWIGANADDLSAANSHRLEALQQFVRQGGRLVVCHSPDAQKIEALASMLPVETRDAAGKPLADEDKKQFVDRLLGGADAPPIDALPWLARNLGHASSDHYNYNPNWHRIDNTDGKHPILIAHGIPKPGAVVALWQNWPKETKRERWPYIVRGAFGLGCVTWVAQDLGDPNITQKTSRDPNNPASEPKLDADNWPHVWDNVIGWRNDTVTYADVGRDQALLFTEQTRRKADNAVDLSRWMNKGTTFAGKGTAYIAVVVLFFIVYWIGAPGAYLVLSRKKRSELNWFVFAAWALLGLAMTTGLVSLLLLGPPEARHLTVVREVVGEPAYVYSRVGLYIPHDGDQAIGLDDTARDALSFITPLQIHPDYVEPTDFPAAQEYAVDVHDPTQPIRLRIPFNTTAKNLQIRWVGESKSSIAGTAQLIAYKGDKGVIAGILINQIGSDLKNVYFAFNYSARGDAPADIVLFVPKWASGAPLDLNAAYSSAKGIGDPTLPDPFNVKAMPQESANTSNIKGPIAGQRNFSWERYWTHIWGGSFTGTDSRVESDYEADAPNVFPILSLYDRIAPAQNEQDPNQDRRPRYDFVRRGGRSLNMSSAVAAGRLVILAQSTTDDRPIPYPLTVDGTRVGGEGRVLYQFALPLDRTDMDKDAAKE